MRSPPPLALLAADRRHVHRIARMSRAHVEAGLPGWIWTPARVHRALRHVDYLTVVAVDGEEVRGAAIAQYLADHVHLSLLVVAPEARRQGLGAALLRWHERCSLDAGTPHLTLEVRASASAAREFYRALGYRPVHRVRRYYQEREDAIRLAKEVPAPPRPY